MLWQNDRGKESSLAKVAEQWTCYVIGDKTVVVHDCLRRHGAVILQSVGWQPFRCRRSPQAQVLLSAIEVDKPKVVWLHLDARQSYVQTPLHHRCTEKLSQLISIQERSGRAVVIEGSWSEVNWSPTLKQMYWQQPTVDHVKIHWCNLGIKSTTNPDKLQHAVHGVFTRNLPQIEERLCTCGKRKTEKHDHDGGPQFDQF